jgi:hypothetical protein
MVIFFATLLGTGTFFSEIHPFTTVPVLREKFAWFAAHADEYDTLFIGTSRVYRGIKPSAFDELTAAAGVPTHSFNFGIDAMSPPEDAYVLERIAALQPKGLRWVFIESGTIRPGVGYGGDDNVRSLHWHDLPRTLIALRALLSPPQRPPGRKELRIESAEDGKPLKRAVAHIQLWCQRTMNAGRGALFLQREMAPLRRVHLSAVLGKQRDGYMVPGDGHPMGEDRADYERRMKEPARISFADRDTQHSLDGMLARLSRLGARPILIIPPTVGRSRQYPQAGCKAPVFDYGEIVKWPGLYQIDHRADRSHLNAAGAEVFTRTVAVDFIELARRPAGSR